MIILMWKKKTHPNQRATENLFSCFSVLINTVHSSYTHLYVDLCCTGCFRQMRYDYYYYYCCRFYCYYYYKPTSFGMLLYLLGLMLLGSALCVYSLTILTNPAYANGDI